MCGVFGFDGVRPVDVGAFAEVARLAARRGPHAAGIAWIADERVEILRAAEPWEKLEKRALAAVAGATRAIGHCRLATAGDYSDPADAQPLPVWDGAVAHNGNVYNWRELAAEHGLVLRTRCDSEVIGLLTRARPLPEALALVDVASPAAVLALWPDRFEVARRGHPLYAWSRPEGTYYCSVRPADDARLVKEATTMRHPIDEIQWVDPDSLRSNDYNPNHVFSPEMRLLKLSILEDGWTQPIVARPDGEIVDGFHRWTLARTDDAVRAASGGKVPVAFLPESKTRADQMIATIRHNRARGQHGILKMGDIVRALEKNGLAADEIQSRLGMDREERERLTDMRGGPESMGKDSFGQGWRPVRR